MSDAFAELREKTLAECQGSPLFAAVSLTLQLGANRPDDGAEVRMGWPLEVAVARAIEVVGDPDLIPEMVAEMTRSAAFQQGLVLHE